MASLPLDPPVLPNLAGYVLGAFAPTWAIARLSKNLWTDVVLQAKLDVVEADPHHNVPIPHLLGILERTLYISTLLLGYEKFIAIWFALRAAGSWKRWADGYNQGDRLRAVPGRTLFNIFCVGFSLSLINALAAYAAIVWATNGRWWQATGIEFAALGSTYICGFWPAVYKTGLP